MNNDLLHETIKQLHDELAHVDHAIRQVEALAKGRPLRGRPPKALSAAREQAAGETMRVRPRARRRQKRDSGDNDR